MPIVTIGIDLAKNVFAVHGIDEAGKAMLIKPRVPRDQLAALIAQLPACLIGMEACSGAHHWARLFQQHGHTVKLMAPNLVAPYRMSGKRGKNDAADAAAICEAVTRPSMRFVPLKDEHQQATLCLHRTRQGFVEERTATYNRLRGLLSEFGVVLPQSPEKLRRYITEHLDALPGWAKRSISDLLEHAGHIEDRLLEYDRAIAEIAREDARSKRLMQLTHARARHRFADCSSIGRIVLAALARHAIRRDKIGRHKLDRMAVLLEHAGPVMSAGACFHPDEARWQLRDQGHQLIARHTRLDQHRFTGLVHTVNGEYILGKIDSDSDNRHGLPLSLVSMNVRNFILAH